MRPGQGSRTAEMVCMARAVANEASPVPQFSDPTAFALLPPKARARVLRFRAEAASKRDRQGYGHAFIKGRSMMMVARTVEIDEAVCSAASPQVVILGAGLDGRAWRMSELRDSVVFEVDHPDTQREKRARIGALTQAAREVRFVPVDFERDDLEVALANAGHDPTIPTTWIWEGVVMYLTPADVEATLAVISRRSAAGSRLVVVYFTRAILLALLGPLVRLLGEPLRSTFRPDTMRTLLARYGLEVMRDEDLAAIGAGLSEEVGRATRMLKHMRIATARRP